MAIEVQRMAAAEMLGKSFDLPPQTSALGALVSHITGGADAKSFQPMNVTFGLMPPLSKEEATVQYETKAGKKKRAKLRGKDRKRAYTVRAKNDLRLWLDQVNG